MSLPKAGAHGEAEQPLKLTIVGARGLRNADWGLAGKSDPYCVCEVLGKPALKLKTQVIKDNLDPTWNHEAEIHGYAPGDVLVFNVYDEDWPKSDDFLGTVTMAAENFHPLGFDGEVPLADAGKGIQAFLRLRIQPWAQPLPTGSQQMPVGSLRGTNSSDRDVALEDLLMSQESLGPQSIAELHARAEASPVAQAVAMAAVCLVAGVDGGLQDPSSLTWEAIKAALANADDLLAAIRNLPPAIEAGRMSSSSVHCSKQCLEVVIPDTLEGEPTMVQHMFFWTMAASNYYDVLEATGAFPTAGAACEHLAEARHPDPIAKRHGVPAAPGPQLGSVTSTAAPCGSNHNGGNVSPNGVRRERAPAQQPLSGQTPQRTTQGHPVETALRATSAGRAVASLEPVRRQHAVGGATRMSRKPSPLKAAVSPPPQKPSVSPTSASRMTRKPSPKKAAVSPPPKAATSPTNTSRPCIKDAKLSLEQLRKETREIRAAEAKLKSSMRRDEERLRRGEKRADDKEVLSQRQQTREERARHEEAVRRARRQAEHSDARDYQEQKRCQKMAQKEEELQCIHDMYVETKDQSEWRVDMEQLAQAEGPVPHIEEHLERYQTCAEYNREERLRDEAELREKRIMEAQNELELKLIQARKDRDMAVYNLGHLQANGKIPIPGNKHLPAHVN